MDGVIIINPDVEMKMKEAIEMLNQTLQGEDYKTLIDYSKGVSRGETFIDTCPIFSNSVGGARKKGRRLTRKKGGMKRAKRADGADARADGASASDSQESQFSPDFSTETPMPPVDEWDSYDYAASAYLIVLGGGIQYLGGFAALINAAGDAIAEVGGIPTQEEACAPLNMLRNAQLGSVITGMMTCEDVQKRYVAIVVGIVSTLGLCVSATVGANAKKVFAKVKWTNLGDIVTALGLAGHTILADGLRKRKIGFPTITAICDKLRNIMKYWGAAGSNNAKLSPEAAAAAASAAEGPILGDGVTSLLCRDVSGSSTDVSGSSTDVSGSSGGRRRRKTKKRRKPRGKRTKKR